MAATLLDLPGDLVHAVVEAYVRRSEVKELLGQGPWVARLFLGPSAMTEDGEGYKLVAQRLGLVRTDDAPTWKEVVDAVRGELNTLEPSQESDLFRVLDHAILHPSMTRWLFHGLCRTGSVRLFCMALTHRRSSATDLAIALTAAVKARRLNMARLALDHGAPVDGTEDTTTPLGLAIDNGEPHLVRLLLERGADRSRFFYDHTLQYLAAICPADDQARQAILELLRRGP